MISKSEKVLGLSNNNDNGIDKYVIYIRKMMCGPTMGPTSGTIRVGNIIV